MTHRSGRAELVNQHSEPVYCGQSRQSVETVHTQAARGMVPHCQGGVMTARQPRPLLAFTPECLSLWVYRITATRQT